MAMSAQDGVFSFASRLVEGPRVEFIVGPFTGFVGVLEALDSRGRIRVLLDLMGRSSLVQSSVKDVAPAAEGTPAGRHEQDAGGKRQRGPHTAALN